MLVHNGQVTGHYSASTALDEVESLLLTRRVQVVKEDPPYSTSLTSVANVEVSVTPGHQKDLDSPSISTYRFNCENSGEDYLHGYISLFKQYTTKH